MLGLVRYLISVMKGLIHDIVRISKMKSRIVHTRFLRLDSKNLLSIFMTMTDVIHFKQVLCGLVDINLLHKATLSQER